MKQTFTLSKTLSGISGLDEITLGGLPTSRPTLVIGNAGTGKTLLGMEFILRLDVQVFKLRNIAGKRVS